MRPSNNKRFSTSDNCNNLTRKEHRALLYLNSSDQMVVVWLQQLKPEWCKLAQKICRACPILWGGPGHHAPGYFLTTRRDPRGQKMKPEGKATLSSLRKWRAARKERVPTISKSG